MVFDRESGRIQSIQRTFTNYAQFDKQRNSSLRAESNPHSLQVKHDGKGLQVFRDSQTVKRANSK